MTPTITARRTRRYTSTRYIRCIIRRVDFNPYGWRRAIQLQPSFVSDYPLAWNNLSPA